MTLLAIAYSRQDGKFAEELAKVVGEDPVARWRQNPSQTTQYELSRAIRDKHVEVDKLVDTWAVDGNTVKQLADLNQLSLLVGLPPVRVDRVDEVPLETTKLVLLVVFECVGAQELLVKTIPETADLVSSYIEDSTCSCRNALARRLRYEQDLCQKLIMAWEVESGRPAYEHMMMGGFLAQRVGSTKKRKKNAKDVVEEIAPNKEALEALLNTMRVSYVWENVSVSELSDRWVVVFS